MENFIIPDAVFDRLDWETVEVEDINDILLGSTVLGAELIGLPNAPDGVLIFFRRPDGGIIAVDFDGNPYATEEAFIISVAYVDPRSHGEAVRTREN